MWRCVESLLHLLTRASQDQRLSVFPLTQLHLQFLECRCTVGMQCVLDKCRYSSVCVCVWILFPSYLVFCSSLFPTVSHLSVWQILGMWYKTKSPSGKLQHKRWPWRSPTPTIHIYKMTQGAIPLLFHLEIQIAGSNLLDLSFSPYVQHLGVN